MPRRMLLLGIAAALCVACAPHEDESTDPEPQTTQTRVPDPEPEPAAKMATASIASVQLVQDCPEQDAAAQAPMPPSPGAAASADEAPPARSMARGAAAKPGTGGAPFRQPCTQSTMQISFTGQGPEAAEVRIEAVRLLAATGEKLGTMSARLPTAWKDDGYVTWDQKIAAKTDVKASYKLSVPNWNDVEAALGQRNPFETMLILEVDVRVGRELQTVRSAEFVRERPHVIVT